MSFYKSNQYFAGYKIGKNDSRYSVAIQDIATGVLSFRLWGFLGWQDIRQRYRRSLLGPFWITISTGVMLLVIATLYGNLFKIKVEVYVPFLSIGVVVWSLIASIINEGCTAFMDAESLIKQTRMPLTIHVCRAIWRNIIIFLHNCVILIPVAHYFKLKFDLLGVAMSLLGVVFIALNGLGFGVCLAAICARFRDIPPVVANLVQVGYFVTPIMWLPELLDARVDLSWVLLINPFHHFMSLVREPILHQIIPTTSLYIVCAVTIVNLFIGGVILAIYKKRVAYWL